MARTAEQQAAYDRKEDALELAKEIRDCGREMVKSITNAPKDLSKLPTGEHMELLRQHVARVQGIESEVFWRADG